MLIRKDISDNDKIILNKLGENADTPVSELLACTQYKRKSSVQNRIQTLEKERYLFGPYYDINFNAIGKNKLYSVFVFAGFHPLYKEAVLEAMRKIDCYTMIYPVRTAEAYLGIYRCSDWNSLDRLFSLMKKWGWLRDYSIYTSEYRWMRQYPDFFGDFLPPHNYQVPQGDIPPYWYEQLKPHCEMTKTDLIVLKHLSRRTCQLSEIRDHEYLYFGLKLRYFDIKKSYEKVMDTGLLIEKHFLIYPLPADICSRFFIFSRGRKFESHLSMIAHFGKRLRLTKEFMVADRWVISYFTAHPLLEEKIMGIIEDYVDYANIFGIRTYPTSELCTKTFDNDYFDISTQKWFFPHSEYEEELKKLKEKREKMDSNL